MKRIAIKPKKIGALLSIAFVMIVALLASGSNPSVSARDGDRILSIYNIHTKETVTVLFKKNGQYVPDAMKKLNYITRDWRKNEPREMDPKLFDLLWEVHTELGSQKPIHLISGYRSPATNQMLKRTRGGQAEKSQHIQGRATDVYFPDISLKQLRYSSLIRERGGVGYYPTSALPFVHLDTGNVRHWPRMPRMELAALFPNGRSKHVPSDGVPITKADYKVAMENLSAGHKEAITLAYNRYNSKDALRPKIQMAGFLPSTGLGRDQEADSSSSKSMSSYMQLRKTDEKVASQVEKGNGKDKRSSYQLASADPKLLPPDAQKPTASDKNPEGLGKWVTSPSFDEEHPDELSYDPFPILPLMKQISVSYDTELIKLEEPDHDNLMYLLGDPVQMSPLRFRAGLQFAEMLWATEFKGEAIVDTRKEAPHKNLNYFGRPKSIAKN